MDGVDTEANAKVPNVSGTIDEDLRARIISQAEDLEAVTVQESLPEGFESSSMKDSSHLHGQEEERAKGNSKSKSHVRIFIEWYRLLSILSLGGILGVLARRGLTSLSSYRGAYLSGVIWSNFTACLIMGFSIESRKTWLQVVPKFGSKAQIPLYVGLTTGFCGSLSSFSSMILEMFEKTTDLLPGKYYNYPNAAYGIMEFLSVLISQISMSVAGLHFGRHIAQLIENLLPALELHLYNILESTAVLCGTVGWIVVVVLAASEHRGRAWTLSCVFAPLGVYSRFYLSKQLNPLFKDFPMGTFASNLIGTILILIFNLLSRGKLGTDGRIVSEYIGCQVLEALSDGYCGNLTTISSFVAELYGLRLLKGYKYGAVSIIVCFILLLLIMGPYNWVVGFSDPVC